MELEEARQRVLDSFAPLETESVALAMAGRRILAESITASAPLPPFDNSAMDGYAVRTADVAKANAEQPAVLRLVGKAAAGQSFPHSLEQGCCVRLFTGSPLPAGADAVVMQEDTRVDPQSPDRIHVLDPVKPWEFVRFQGEDVKHGALLAEPGDRITAGLLSLLAAAGVSHLTVHRQPVVGLLATGNELSEPGRPLGPAQIYESNRIGLSGLVQQAGGLHRTYPIVPDSETETRAALERTLAECDVVVSTGGVSVGEYDLVRSAFQKIGGTLNFWKVAIKPGKPFTFGQYRNHALFGLPGNPVSARVTFWLLVRPALLRLQGASHLNPPMHPGVLAEPLSNPGERRHFIRVQVDDQGNVRPSGVQASHALSSLARADGLVDVPAGAQLAAGTAVKVIRWES